MARSPAVDAAFDAELARLTRLFVDFRSSRLYVLLVPLSVVALLHPSPARVGVLAALALGAFTITRRDRSVDPEALSVTRIASLGRFVLVVHGVIALVTGGLGSPMLPVVVVATFAVSLLLGAHPARRTYLASQVGVVVALAAAHAAGLVRALAIPWMTLIEGPAHLTAAVTVLVFMLVFTSTLAVSLRASFEDMVSRVSDARADLLETHRAQNAELTTLSGAIAHELKNPLASIKGLTALLSRDVSTEKAQERLGVLRSEIDRMQGIIQEFLTFSRPLVPAVVVRADLRALADEVAGLHEGLGRKITVVGTGHAEVDLRKMRQILINLVQNALEASPGDAAIQIVVEGSRITVDDQGPGPDPALGERLFEAGVTTRADGNGLGLTIARALARQQGGEVTLARRPGGGGRASFVAGAPS